MIGLISSRENRLKKKLSASYKRLHKQARKLVEAEKQLGESQSLSMLGHVSASFAHEIKNPLGSIKGVTESMTRDIEARLNKFGANIIMVPKSENLSLSYGGIDVGGVNYKIKEFDQKSLVNIRKIKNSK